MMMNTRRALLRIAIALVISVALNCVLFAAASSYPRQENLSRIESIANALLMPAGELTAWLVPGHTGTQVVVSIVISIAIYTAVAWVTISLPAWWQRRG
jgi:hypothetical protein